MDENNPQVQAPVVQQPDNVWISREEYIRLKQMESVVSGAAQQTNDVGESYVDEPNSKAENRWTIIGLAALGVLTLLAFTTSAFSFTAPLLLMLLLLAGGLSVARALRFKGAPQSAVAEKKGLKKTIALVILIVGITLVAPQAMMMVMFLILMLPLMLVTGGRGT